VDLGIAQISRGNALRLAGTPWPSRGFGLLPLSKELQKNIGIMREGIRGKQRKRSVQTFLNLSKESAGTVEVTIPNQRSQTETKFRSKGSPDPRGPQASTPTLWKEKGCLGIIAPMRFWWFFFEGPKFIHLDLGEFEVPKEHIVDLLTMQGGRGQPPPDRIKLDLQDSGGTTKTQAFGQQPKSHENFLFGTS
jgi:hypothetical protein